MTTVQYRVLSDSQVQEAAEPAQRVFRGFVAGDQSADCATSFAVMLPSSRCESGTAQAA